MSTWSLQMKVNSRGAPLGLLGLVAVTLSVTLSACMSYPPIPPSTFVAALAGWKTIELRPELIADPNQAWQTTVDSVAMNWPIEVLDKDSGYIRTGYIVTSGTHVSEQWQYYWTYSSRLILKFPTGNPKDTVTVKTETVWCNGRATFGGYDTGFSEDVMSLLHGRLGRTGGR